MEFLTKRIGVKVALIVNIGLFVIMSLGTWFLIDRQNHSLEEQMLERGKIESIVGAKMISQILEEAVDNGVLKVEDFLISSMWRFQVLILLNFILNMTGI